jgi:hypothetical protein
MYASVLMAMNIIKIIIIITVIIVKHLRSNQFGDLILNSVHAECDVFAFSEFFRNAFLNFVELLEVCRNVRHMFLFYLSLSVPLCVDLVWTLRRLENKPQKEKLKGG